jgi:MFS family permease
MAERMPRGFGWLIGAQFLSALADHTLLIITIAHLQFLGAPVWWAPLLKFAFTLSYVFLAPFIGALADSICKRRLMVAMHLLKLLGAVLLLAGLPPLWAFALVGLGAAAYAPAKYGLLTESVPSSQLVAANGWIETAVVLSVLLGTVLGGVLVAPVWLNASWVDTLATTPLLAWGASAPELNVSMAVVVSIYAVAGFFHLGIRPSGARYPLQPVAPLRLLAAFASANRRLWADASGGLSLAVTTVFWGAGALMQFAVLHWSVQYLGLGLDQAAYLQGLVAVGVVAGAVLAAWRVRMRHASRVLPLGLALGALMALSVWVPSWPWAVPSLLLVGAIGGMLVVPMNALLQLRGHRLLTSGQSIAVQGFNENLSILVTLSVYAGLLALDVPVRGIMAMAGVMLLMFIALLIRGRHRVRV